jgi:hypothetical protein
MLSEFPNASETRERSLKNREKLDQDQFYSAMNSVKVEIVLAETRGDLKLVLEGNWKGSWLNNNRVADRVRDFLVSRKYKVKYYEGNDERYAKFIINWEK